MNEHKKRLKPFLDDINKTKSNNIAIIIRHSIREGTESGKEMSHWSLTNKGKDLAFWFGTELPKNRILKLFHSPYERCKKTSKYIKVGFESIGGKVENVEESEFLECSTNHKKIEKKILELGIKKFILKWFKGEMSEKIIKNPKLVVEKTLQEILSNMKNGDKKYIYITHDTNIAAMKQLLLDVDYKKFGRQYFLGGIIIIREVNKIKLKWRNFEKTIDWKI